MPDRPRATWFAARRYGYGAGLPVVWQGWACLVVFIGVSLLPWLVLVGTPQVRYRAIEIIFGGVVFHTVATVVFLLVCRSRTEGKWQWRWGDRE